LLALDPRVKKLVEEGLLSAGHARTLIGVDGAYDKAKKIIEKNLSVREAEKLARQSDGKSLSKSATKAKPKDVDTIALERDLSNLLGLKVTVDGSGQKGVLRIAYDDLDQLDLVIEKLKSADKEPESTVVELTREEIKPQKEEMPKLSVSLKPKRQ